MSTPTTSPIAIQQALTIPKPSAADKDCLQTVVDGLLDEFHREGQREVLDPKNHRHIRVINLWKNVKAKTVFNIIKRYSDNKRQPQVLGVEIFKSNKENEVTAIVRLETDKSAFKAAERFPKETDWKWNKGFKAKITELITFWLFWRDGSISERITPFWFHTRYPDFFGQRIDDKWEDLQPGCIVQLPATEHFKAKSGVCVDVRLADIRGHPVIIVKRHGNYLVNIVVCTTFHSRSADNVFRSRPEKLREFVQIDSVSGSRDRRRQMNGCEGPTSPRGLLTFEGDLCLPRGGYAGTMVYTTSLESLARLQVRGLEDPPGGFLKLYNVDYLLKRIRGVGDNPNVEYFTTDDPDKMRKVIRGKENGRGILATSILNDARFAKYL